MILIDTHALIWAVDDYKKLSRPAASAIRRARQDGGIAISAISIWEISSLLVRGRVRAYGTLEASIQIFLEDVAIRPITAEICALGALFPDDYSHDPADRIIGGTARAEGLTLVTHDEKIRRSSLLRTVW
ncbi:MAG: type II toxin-antitoxin system VapC family toxin [Candidatus Sulfotelmatobacter sp.]